MIFWRHIPADRAEAVPITIICVGASQISFACARDVYAPEWRSDEENNRDCRRGGIRNDGCDPGGQEWGGGDAHRGQ